MRGVAWCLLAIPFQGLDANASETRTPIFEGVTLIRRVEDEPQPIRITIALVDLRAEGVRFKLTSPQGTRDTQPQTTLEFLNQEKAQLAINCHFYLPFPAQGSDVQVVGFAASEGVLYSPFEGQPIAAGFVDQSYAILPWAPAMNIDPSNRVSILHGDPSQPDGRSWLEEVVLGNAFSGSAQIVTDGVVTIPHYGVSPGMLQPRNGYSEDLSWYEFLRGRTAVGITRDHNTLVLFTADISEESWGMTVGEVAEMLVRDYDVVDALNLDGDGSTTMAMEDPVSGQGVFANVPGEPPGGRAVGSNLAVFARPLKFVPLGPALMCSPVFNGMIRLSWVSTGVDVHLEETLDLGAPSWSPVAAQPVEFQGRRELLIPLTEPQRFFRLAQ